MRWCQLAGLKALIDTRAGSIATVGPLAVSVTDPPSADDVQAIVDKVNELITALHQ